MIFRSQPAILAALLAGALAVSAASVADAARRKFDAIAGLRLPAGARVNLSASELDAWAADEARVYAPGAVRNIRLTLARGAATGSALIDFVKLHQAAAGEEPGWLAQNLFAGERPVTVTAHFASASRRARVDVDRVEVSGVVIEGATLRFLIDNWLRPEFPGVKIGEWFDLGFRIERFTVSPSAVSVFISR